MVSLDRAVGAHYGQVSEVRAVIDMCNQKHPGVWDLPMGKRQLRLAAHLAARMGFRSMTLFFVQDLGVAVHEPPADLRGSGRPAKWNYKNGDIEHDTPLSGAIIELNEDLAIELLSLPVPEGQKLDLSFCMEKGFTMLHQAVRGGMVRLVLDLVKKKGMDSVAALEAQSEKGMTAIEFAVMGGNVEIVRVLLDAFERKGHLQRALTRAWATPQGDGAEVMSLLLMTLTCAMDADTHRNNEATCLAITRLLVEEKKCDIHKACNIDFDSDGLPIPFAPLHAAARRGFISIVDFLLNSDP
jgi:ankyrin repeat protein